MQKLFYISLLIIVTLTVSCNNENSDYTSDSWNSYLHDDQNTGVTTDTLPFPLHKSWTREFQNPPQPAWPSPAKQDYYNAKRTLEPLVTYDRAFQPVVHGKSVFVASSANNTINCYNAESGKVVWKFYTEAPNRVAHYGIKVNSSLVQMMGLFTVSMLWMVNCCGREILVLTVNLSVTDVSSPLFR